MNQRLLSASNRLESWIKDLSIPLWMKSGLDSHAKAHYERLLASGEPDKEANVRVRVQARQIFVFAYAHHLGWCDDAYLGVEPLWSFLESKTRHPEAEDGYTHLLGPDFSVIDPKQDLYDHAFFILAHTWVYKAFGKSEALERVEKLVSHLDKAFGSDVGGWFEGDYEADCRRQNPHMHLFEAFLALYSVTGASKWLARASEIFALFQTRFYAADSKVLLEYFDDAWGPLAGQKGEIVEPGHMMEWVWLLRWYESLSGRPVSHYADALYNKAVEIGFCENSGLMYDEVDAAGKIFTATKRCWPMTEVIKANIAQAKAGHTDCEEQAAIAIEKLFEFYLCASTPGSYVDRRGENNEVVVDFAPASTLYHLIVAAAEASQYCKQVQSQNK